jgi:hypothetical protein
MASANRINLDPAAPDSLYAGARKVNAALDETEARLEALERELQTKISNSLCLHWMEV